MLNLRKYGPAPYCVAVVHGGPGVAGEMAPVARKLAKDSGVLEPLQTVASLAGQVKELQTVIEANADLPITLIGYSWGAWISYMLAASCPALIKKLILIASAPFDEKYAAEIQRNRFQRLSVKDRMNVAEIIETLQGPSRKDNNRTLERLGAILSKADAYNPCKQPSENPDELIFRADIYRKVWAEGRQYRKSGKLWNLGKHITCPVVAVHGDFDPHPAAGVAKPLGSTLKQFRFILLKNCGHKPWLEHEAKEEFFRILKAELSETFSS